MDTERFVEETVLKYPICEYCISDTEKIPFSDKVWFICETDCKRYNNSWACPPRCGSIEENIAKCKSYDRFILFSTIIEVSNAWDTEVCLKAKGEHELLTREIKAELENSIDDFYVLSTGCAICDECACPDEPCRHPEERLSSMESHGIVVMQIADEMGLCFNYGGDTVVYFSMIFFNK